MNGIAWSISKSFSRLVLVCFTCCLRSTCLLSACLLNIGVLGGMLFLPAAEEASAQLSPTFPRPIMEPGPRGRDLCRLNPPDGGPFDCDDYAYEYCQQFPSDDCKQLGIYGDPSSPWGHVVPIIRREIIPGLLWEFCIEDPQSLEQLQCWYSSNPEMTLPAEIQRIVCDYYRSWGLDCSLDPSLIIYDGNGLCRDAGEPLWTECGSLAMIRAVCGEFNRVGLSCPFLPYCADLIMSAAGCTEGETTRCNTASGSTSAIGCCVNGLGIGEWCMEAPLPMCRDLEGTSCDVAQQNFVDCWSSIWSNSLTTLRCEPCGAIQLGAMCWKRYRTTFSWY